MASLSDSMSDADCRLVRNALLGKLTGKSPGNTVLNYAAENLLTAGVFRDMWRSDRGRRIARNITFHDCSYEDMVQLPMRLAMHGTMQQLVDICR
jgi:hypothetical protein